MDQTWVSRDYQRRLNGELAQFTRQTGIRLEFLPGPETTTEQLATYRKLLEAGAKVPDIYGIDVICPGILADNLLDLRAYIPDQEIQAHFPELIAANTVNGRLVALSANLNEGMLFYRVDLLRKYGYRAPRQTQVRHRAEPSAIMVQTPANDAYGSDHAQPAEASAPVETGPPVRSLFCSRSSERRATGEYRPAALHARHAVRTRSEQLD
jgi:hypothetical protein